jgi:hypothetical protein
LLPLSSKRLLLTYIEIAQSVQAETFQRKHLCDGLFQGKMGHGYRVEVLGQFPKKKIARCTTGAMDLYSLQNLIKPRKSYFIYSFYNETSWG